MEIKIAKMKLLDSGLSAQSTDIAIAIMLEYSQDLYNIGYTKGWADREQYKNIKPS